MQFAALSSAGVTFDLFSYGPDTGSPGGGLVISGLHIDMMSGELGEPDPVTYGFDASAVTFDEATSHVRSGGLINHFPLTLKRLLQAGGNDTPASLHWMSVTTPIGQGPFAWPWFGLQLDLDLGSFGALAGDVGFTVGLLLAWAPRGTSDSVFVGLTMPGAVGGNKRQIGLEGVLALTFGGLDLALPAAPPDVQPPPGYVLTLRNIQLSLLSVGFPRTGQTNVYIFGDPSGGSDPALGWYAAYGTGTSTQSGAAAVLVPDLVAPARLAALGRRR
jgi:hypothetical protein